MKNYLGNLAEDHKDADHTERDKFVSVLLDQLSYK